jgi:LAGLIDADG DNA endonuclease family
VLSTHSFTLAEVKLLVDVLTDKFGLKCTINKNNGAFVIRISAKSIPALQAMLKDIMPSMMLYKIGL